MDDLDDDYSERDMDALRGLRTEPGFDPDGPPPPESVDPLYGSGGAVQRRDRSALASRGGRGVRRSDAPSAGRATTRGGAAPQKRGGGCDWDTILIIVLAIVLFSFLILDIYAQIVRHTQPRCHMHLPSVADVRW
eukprot:COSAG01_NODE_1202_length_11263_cov_64.078466_7_plen_135_part_00